MSNDDLAVEAERSRAVAMLSVGTVIALFAAVFCFWLSAKDSAKADTNATVAQLVSINEHKGLYIFAFFMFAISTLLIAPVFAHLALAVRARVATTPKYLLIAAIAGPLIAAAALPAYMVAQVAAAGDFANAAVHTTAEANKLLDGTGIQITTWFFRIGQVAFGVTWALIGIAAMRAGLLTRLFGYVAVAIGVANVVGPPLAALISVFWVGAVAIMLLGKSVHVPPAWVMGRAVPWSEVAAIRASELENPDELEKL